MSGLIEHKRPVPITYSDTHMFDAFGRLRVSEIQTVHDSKLLIDAAPNLWDDKETSGTGTSSVHSKLRASVTLGVSNLTAGKRERQTKRWFDYQPGKSQLTFITFVMGAATTGIIRRVGLFSTNNGVFLEQNAADVRFVIRSYLSGTPVDTNYAAQANWNVDKLDGTGPSGVTLDLTKSQIMFIDLEWLGVGRVNVGFVIDGVYAPCHRFLNANVNASVYMSTPNLPIRYSIQNDGTGPAATLECICSSVMSEGGRSEIGYERGVSRTSNPMATGDNSFYHPIIAIRLNGSYPGATVKLLDFSIGCTTSSPFNWFWIENPTITGGALAFAGVNNSAVEADFTSGGSLIAVASTGTVIRAGISVASDLVEIRPNSEMQLGSYLNGASDVWALCVQRLTGSSETFYAALNWRETGG